MTALLLMVVLAVQGLQPGTGIVTGVLKTPDGRPASGVRVGAVDINDPTQWLSLAETDAAGRFRLTNVPSGRYHIVGGRLNDLRYYPKGEDRSTAEEVNRRSSKNSRQCRFHSSGRCSEAGAAHSSAASQSCECSGGPRVPAVLR